jgi:hypothetical protein
MFQGTANEIRGLFVKLAIRSFCDWPSRKSAHQYNLAGQHRR